MKSFIKRCFFFIAIAFPLISAESLYNYFTKRYERTVNGNEVYVSINKSKARKKTIVLIIGDSVGKQLYDNDTYNGDIYSEACNQAISVAGFFFLLNNFVKINHGQLPSQVLLIITPESFKNNLDQIYTFHYFLKPFYKAAYQKDFTPACWAQVHKIPLYYLSQMPFIVNTDWTPKYTPPTDTACKIISPISRDYLIKIKQLCDNNHMRFSILCPPVKQSKKIKMLAFSKAINEFEQCGLKTEFEDYFNNIEYKPDSLYIDNIHFKKQYIPIDYFKIVGRSSE